MVKIEVYTTPHLCERDHHCLFGPLSAREWSILFGLFYLPLRHTNSADHITVFIYISFYVA